MKESLLLLLASVALLLSSCGYRPGYGTFLDRYSSLSVPYVVGDLDGALTAELVRAVASSLTFDHSSTEGELLLIVKLLDVENENIGFRYENLHGKKYKRSIIPVETRLTATAEITVVNAATGCSLIPPARVTAFYDFDHEYNATEHDSNTFSLGQLSDADAAFAAARVPLNRLLAQKIIEYIYCISYTQN
jgi:hypothetical protein